MDARAPTSKDTSFTAYPRAQRSCFLPLPHASCFRSAEEDLEMAAAARYMVASRAVLFAVACVVSVLSFSLASRLRRGFMWEGQWRSQQLSGRMNSSGLS
jgi:hypothetical protein